MISVSHIYPMLFHFPIAWVVLGFIVDCALVYFRKETYLSTMNLKAGIKPD